MKRFSESAHRITVSLDDVEPVTVTLPHPIVPDTIKATLSPTDSIVDIIAAKALHGVWPDDDIQHKGFRWNAETLEPRTYLMDDEQLESHLLCQLPYCHWKNKSWPLPSDLEARRNAEESTQVRFIIGDIFGIVADQKDQHELRFQLKINESSHETADWYVRAHLPIRISPLGTPIVLLSAVDQRLSESLQKEGKLDRGPAKKNFHRIFGHVSEEERIVIPIPTMEVARLFRYILRLNSTRIRPTEWQKENVPQGNNATSPYLTTFIGCLYRECTINDNLSYKLLGPLKLKFGYCSKCWEISSELKHCGRCKAVSYCSVKCQLDDWPVHKLSCIQL